MKLLLVDDNSVLLEQMSKYLRRHGHEVITALDGEEALEALEKEAFRVCITDLKMPGLTGQELLKLIRERYPQTSVVIMTAYGTVKGALEALKEGAFDFIHKPFQMEQIMEVLQRILDSKTSLPAMVTAS